VKTDKILTCSWFGTRSINFEVIPESGFEEIYGHLPEADLH
jgi:hypothetical protein